MGRFATFIYSELIRKETTTSTLVIPSNPLKFKLCITDRRAEARLYCILGRWGGLGGFGSIGSSGRTPHRTGRINSWGHPRRQPLRKSSDPASAQDARERRTSKGTPTGGEISRVTLNCHELSELDINP